MYEAIEYCDTKGCRCDDRSGVVLYRGRDHTEAMSQVPRNGYALRIEQWQEERMRWTAKYQENGGYDCMTDAWTIVDASGATVCLVDLRHFGQEQCQPASLETEAKAADMARMIVTAPELAEALTQFVAEFDLALAVKEPPPFLSRTVDPARALLARLRRSE